MPRFFIEVPHDPSPKGCTLAVESLLRTGSHFLTHADWGCKDGEHKAWLIMEFDTKDEALNAVPPDFRKDAKVVQLNWFVLDEKRRARPSMIAAHKIS
jgi:hypothetical protein